MTPRPLGRVCPATVVASDSWRLTRTAGGYMRIDSLKAASV